MRLALQLVLANLRQHPARMCLTALAMVASACVVVWVVSGYDAMVGQFGDVATEYLGRYDLFVVPDSKDLAPTIGQPLIAALRADPAVAEVEPVSQTPARVMKPGGRGGSGGGLGMGGGPGMRRGGKPGGRGGMAGGPGMGRGAGRGGMSGGMPGGGASPDEMAQEQTLRGPIGSTLPIRDTGKGGMMMPPSLVGTDAKEPPYAMVDGRWIDREHPARREAVLSNNSAEQLGVKVGDEVLLIVGPKEYKIKIIGTCQQASMQGGMRGARMGASPGPATSAVYVPLALADELTRHTAKVNLVNVKLKPGTDLMQFRLAWASRVAEAKPAVLMLGIDDIKASIQEGMSATNARKQAWAATGMSLLAALFIIFTTLSMGVNERVRQFAVMRGVGLTRGQVAGLIAIEGMLLALVGWAGGLLAGWGLLAIVNHWKPGLFVNGASLGIWCVLLSGASAFGGALAASLLPAWQATSVEPLDAMSPRRSLRPGMKRLLAAGLLGLLLIAVNPYLVYVAVVPDAMRYAIYQAVGCTSMCIGFLLLTPLTIVVAEAVLVPAVGRLLGLNPQLLASQLSTNVWRTLGTTVALTVGLGLYVAMQVWGYSMLEPFLPGDWAPDMLISFQSGGLPDSEIDAVRHAKGVIADQCQPLAVEQPRLASDITHRGERMSKIRGDNVVIIGLDPQLAFGGTKPLVRTEFVDGSRTEVIEKLKDGRNCVVPDFFIRTTGLKVGDQFEVLPPEAPEKPFAYTIVGVVKLPGAHYMTKFSGLRRRSGGMAAIVFAPFAQVRRDFNLKQINFCWMNIDKEHVDINDIGLALQPIADRNLGEQQPVNGQGAWSHRARMYGSSLRITLPADLRANLFMRADLVIWSLSQLPLITLLVTSLGVVNTVMASVRARRWELGVMRALGVTRSGLFRLVLAEGLLIGLVACVLSFAFGVMAGWCGTGISQYVSVFGGLNPPLVIPWSKLALGFSATLALCLIAALWPAITTGRAEPLQLLQEGRAAM
jgi:putative ABC transport system permease protein